MGGRKTRCSPGWMDASLAPGSVRKPIPSEGGRMLEWELTSSSGFFVVVTEHQSLQLSHIQLLLNPQYPFLAAGLLCHIPQQGPPGSASLVGDTNNEENCHQTRAKSVSRRERTLSSRGKNQRVTKNSALAVTLATVNSLCQHSSLPEPPCVDRPHTPNHDKTLRSSFCIWEPHWQGPITKVSLLYGSSHSFTQCHFSS